MRAYIYCADIWCEDCAKATMAELDAAGVQDDGDSDTYPQGPYSDGGGEADSPQHCGNRHDCPNGHDVTAADGRTFHIGAHLENPLTSHGEAYVRELVAEGDGLCDELWRTFYAYLFE